MDVELQVSHVRLPHHKPDLSRLPGVRETAAMIPTKEDAERPVQAEREDDVGPYPPIRDYAIIGDCHTAALVSSSASVDWCCLPRFDSGAAFGRLLDWERGGHCSIEPMAESYHASREYLDDTLVLVTTFQEAGGEAKLLDCFPMHEGGARQPYRQLLRVVEGVRGSMELQLLVRARFDYGGVKPWLRQQGPNTYSAMGGNDAILVSSDADLDIVDDHDLAAHFVVRAGERVRLSIVYYPPEELDPEAPPAPEAEELDRRLDETIGWWRRWVDKIDLPGPYGPEAPARR